MSFSFPESSFSRELRKSSGSPPNKSIYTHHILFSKIHVREEQIIVHASTKCLSEKKVFCPPTEFLTREMEASCIFIQVFVEIDTQSAHFFLDLFDLLLQEI